MKRRQTITQTVEVDVDVDIDMADLDTPDLIEEVQSRGYTVIDGGDFEELSDERRFDMLADIRESFHARDAQHFEILTMRLERALEGLPKPIKAKAGMKVGA